MLSRIRSNVIPWGIVLYIVVLVTTIAWLEYFRTQPLAVASLDPTCQCTCDCGCACAQTVPTGTPVVQPTWTPRPTFTPVLPTPTPVVSWQVPATIPIYIVTESTGGAHWAIVAVRFEDTAQAGGRHDVYYRLEDQNGAVAYGQHVCLAWPSGDDCSHPIEIHDQYYPQGYNADYPLYGGSWNPANGPGPYSAFVSGALTDVLKGMGLPFSQHVNYYVTWRWKP